MEFITKCLIFSIFLTVAYCRKPSCDCGVGTLDCTPVPQGKMCTCENNKVVVNSLCSDCLNCDNVTCKCDCPKGFGWHNKNVCYGLIELEPEYLTAALGEDVTLPCNYPFPDGKLDPFMLLWRKQGEISPFYMWVGGQSHPVKSYEDRASMDDVWPSLHLTRVRQADQGWYECTLRSLRTENDKFPNHSVWVHLEILGTVEPKPNNITAIIGQDVILPCDFPLSEGKDSPYMVKWQKKDVITPIYVWRSKLFRPYSAGEGRATLSGYEGRARLIGYSSLSLTRVTENDVGWYECKVDFLKRPFNTDKNGSWVHLDVLGTVEPKPKNITALIGEDVILPCYFPFYKSKDSRYTVKWQKKDVITPIYIWRSNLFRPYNAGEGRAKLSDYEGRATLSGQASLNLTKVRESDAGWYECKVDFFDTEINGSWIHLHVLADSHFSVDERSQSVLNVKAEDNITEDRQHQSTSEDQLSIIKRPPEFYMQHYEATIPENQKKYSEITEVKAKSFSNRDIRYRLRTQGKGYGTFSIGPTTGVVELAKDLDYDNPKQLKTYYLIVTATEEGSGNLSTNVELIIHVTDVNDNAPRFELPDYEIYHVNENVPVGTSILQVSASDMDQNKNAEIEYSLDKDDFIIDNNGVIYSNKHLDADMYVFTVRATDKGDPPLTGTATVHIYTENKSSEKDSLDTFVTTMAAIDKDNDIKRFGRQILSFFKIEEETGSLYSEKNISEIIQDSNCSCDWRYFKHYEAKECILEKTDSCGCPQKFICPFNETQQAPAKVCTYQNKEYSVGSKIITSDICQVCRCRGGVPPSISCVTRECPEIKAETGKECHLVYEDGRCCPVGVECIVNEAEAIPNKTCEYDGRYYPFGSKIYPADDPCQICICDENWNGVYNGSCYQQDCMFERNKPQLNIGCIPVYHESRCCPIEFYCPSSHNLSYSVLSTNSSSEQYNISQEKGDECVFADQTYPVGEELSINNPCVKCSCTVPPDFTCIHQKCSPSPSEGTCEAVFTEGECCPSYECMLGDADPLRDCPTPLCADENCKIDVPLGQRCPTCICKGCPTPLCADSSCRIEIPPGHECPTCVCGERFAELERNNLEQVQQEVNQNIDEFEVQQALEPGEGIDDSTEDLVQMMPIRMEDSESQSSVLEKMIAPESEFAEVEEELLNNSVEDDSSSERVNSGLEEVHVADENNSMSLTEPQVNNTHRELEINESEKLLQKRSDVSDAINHSQNKVTPVEQKETYQQNIQGFNENLEREGVGPFESSEDFDGELESFKNRNFDKNKTIINKVININHVVKVPPGCPTPMCEGPWCKIGILPGEKCPTCICKRPNPGEQ